MYKNKAENDSVMTVKASLKDFLKAAVENTACTIGRAFDNRRIKKIRSKLLAQLAKDDLKQFQKRLNKYRRYYAPTILSGIKFPKHLDFTGLDFSDTSINASDFEGMKLNKANFSRSKARNACFRNTQCQNASFSYGKLYGANFRDANLTGCDFYNADLRNADFRNADLTEASFYETNMDGADLRGAKLDAVELADIYHNNSNVAFDRWQMLKISLVRYEQNFLKVTEHGRSIETLVKNAPPRFLTIGGMYRGISDAERAEWKATSSPSSNPSAPQTGF